MAQRDLPGTVPNSHRAESPSTERAWIGELKQRAECPPIMGVAILGQAAPPPRTSVLPDTPHAPYLRAANYLDMFDLAFPLQELWDPDS